MFRLVSRMRCLLLLLAALACTRPPPPRVVGARLSSSKALEARAVAVRRVEWRASRQAQAPAEVRLLAINDFHGQLPTGRVVAGHPVGSAGVLAAWLKAAEAGAEDRTLIVHAGDQIGASPPASALLHDEPAISFLNLFANHDCQARERLDRPLEPWMNPHCNLVGTLGNHEFDNGRGELLRLLAGGNHPKGPFLENPWRGARYPTLAANVVDARTGQPILPPFVVKWIHGVPIGFIGLVLKEAPSMVIPSGTTGLKFLDEADTANAYVEQLKRQNVHAIVILIHQGGSQHSDAGMAAGTSGIVFGPIVDIVRRLDDEVDVVASGHTHQFTNALLPSAGGKPVLVTQAFSYGTAYAQIDLEIDRATRDVTAKSAVVQTTWADEGPGLRPDPAAARLQAAADAKVAPLVRQVIGTAAEAMPNDPNTAGESALGNLIADAERAAIPGANAAFMNPGGIRADLAPGPITWGDLFSIQPFGNSIVGLSLLGTEIRALLEEQWLGRASPRILLVSGIAYTFSASAPPGSKVSNVRVGGMPLEETASYRVAVNSFLAAGGDGFAVLARGRREVGGPLDLSALITWIRAQKSPLTAPMLGRITQAK